MALYAIAVAIEAEILRDSLSLVYSVFSCSCSNPQANSLQRAGRLVH